MTIGAIGGFNSYTAPISRPAAGAETSLAAPAAELAAESTGLSKDNVVGGVQNADSDNNVKEKKNGEPCQTCKERTYQDGSDDPGVSFKSAAHIDPNVAASVVMGHEQEHVSHEQSQAKTEGREVISQNVVLHTSVCPECGRTYVAGGTTTTVTGERTKTQQDDEQDLWPGSGIGMASDAEPGRFIDNDA